MSGDENKEITLRYFDAFMRHDLAALQEFCDPGIIEHPAPPGQAPGIEGFIQHKARAIARWPDAKITVDDMIAEGDKVAFRFSLKATDSQTCRPFHVKALAFGRMANGKIVEVWQGVIEEEEG